MASTPARAKSGFRHRIQEISLSPTPSKHPIELELLIDGTPIYGLPAVAPGSPLRWSLASHPCDVQSDSKITLKIIEKHFLSQRNRVGYLEYLVCNVGETASIHLEAGNPTSQSLGFGSANKRWDHGGPFAVGLTFPDRDRVEDAYLVALNKADMMMESKKGPLEGLGRFRDMFKTLIDVGKLVAEMNSSAKLVVELCAMAWEHLEKLQQLHDDLRKLLEGLERILPFIDYVKEYAQNSLLGDTVTSLLNLIEDSSHFMLGYFSNGTTVRLLRSTFDGRAPDRVGELLQRFTDLKEDFDRSIRVQLLASVLTNAQRTLIDKLNLTTQSHYDHTPPCQTGTRQQILDDINQWLDDQNTTEKLLWLYGHAGQGKSSIAASVSRAFNGQGTLGAHFFCKRDDPDLRSPERILNTIVHRLAMKYKAYGHAVSSAIDSNTELPNSSLQSRYSNLIEKPLQTLVLKKKERPGLLVVIVDALDECDKGDGRRSILAYLRGLSMLVPWIKVIVTSRPDQDIKLAFGKSKDSIICARNVHDYNASDDIYAYIHSKMTDIAAERDRADWPDETIQLLSQRADGLFIWAATACRFISDAVNVDQRLKQVLEGTESSGSSYRLDVLYTTAIRHSMDSEDQDNIEYTRQCIAAVVATASRTPLSVPALEALLGNKFGTGTLRRVVARLGSVLYEDEKKGDVVRAYHPSFADYATNPARSKEMYVATESINTTLAECCLAMMLRELRFNICGLETSHLLNHDIPNLCSRVQSAIRPHLEYSCLHWSSHLAGAPKGAQTSELGEFLLGPVLLFWIEALSLMSKLGTALSSLQEITNNTSSVSEIDIACARDAYRFVLTFYDVISESTPHLYISALPLAPKKSMIAERMWTLFPNMLKVTQSADEHWSACMRTLSPGQNLHSMVVSPDGRLIATSCYSAVQIWDHETGDSVSDPLECPHGGLAFSHDGSLLFCRSHFGGIRGWNVETFEPVLMTLPTTSEFNSAIAISCNDYLAVSAPNNYGITAWNLRSGTVAFELIGHSDEVQSIAFSPNGHLIASGSNDMTMRVWDGHTGAALSTLSFSVETITFSPDSCYIASSSSDGIVQIWDALTYTPTMELRMSRADRVAAVAYSPDGRSVVASSGDSLWVWDLNERPASPTPLRGHTATVHSVRFSLNGRRIISGSFDNNVRIWDVDAQPTSIALPDPLNCANHVVFSPDSLHVLLASDDNTLSTWETSTSGAADDTITGPEDCSECLLISPDCRRAVSRDDRAHRVWDIGSRSAITMDGAASSISAAAFSSDGLRLVSSHSDGSLRVHNVETGAILLEPVAAGQGASECVAYSPCGRYIAASSDYAVCVWGADTGEAVGNPRESGNGFSSIAFSPDGRLIAAGSYNVLLVWETETGTLIHEIFTGHGSLITALVFSPSGRHLVSGSFDRTLRIWDLDSNTPTSELLIGHKKDVTCLAFSPDGNLIASGSSDHTVRIWDAINSKKPISHSLDSLTSALYPAAHSLSNPPPKVPQTDEELHKLPNLIFPTSHLAHRLTKGGWVSLTKGSVLLWLPPDYRAIDDSSVQISPRLLPRYSVGVSKFVHGDRWMSAASDSVRCYNMTVRENVP